MNQSPNIGIGTWHFRDLTLRVLGVKFHLTEDGIPSVDPADRAVLDGVIKSARQAGNRFVEYEFDGRSIGPSPISFDVKFDPEIGSFFDVYTPGEPAQLKLQEPRYREYVAGEYAREDQAEADDPCPSLEVVPPDHGDKLRLRSPNGWRFEVRGSSVVMVRRRASPGRKRDSVV